MRPKLHLPNVLFFAGTALAALAGGVAYAVFHGVTWAAPVLLVVMISLTLNSISAGYHRLYAHRAYEASVPLKIFHLVFGAAAIEQSCAKWATEHRAHHRYVDTDRDPYNIKQGFFWAHMGWILHHDRHPFETPRDLRDDPWIRWQAKYWVPLGLAAGFGLPTLVGWALGDPWGGFLFGGLIRMVLGHHFTFMINSLAHTVGSQPYSDESTARDSWITAIFTFGEGYHNYHHWSPSDYRNGTRWFHWDPPKWFIWANERLGWARNLKRQPEEVITAARARMALRAIPETVREGETPLAASFRAFQTTVEELSARRRELTAAVGPQIESVKAAFGAARRAHRRAWRELRAALRQAPGLTASS